jgi:hypothetical protein
MIVERESTMSIEERANKIYFPNFLIVRQQADHEQGGLDQW